MRAAIQVIAVLTLLSGLHVAFRMREVHAVIKREPEAFQLRLILRKLRGSEPLLDRTEDR